MNKVLFAVLLTIAIAANVHAAQSSITDAEGSACMGEDKSRKQTEEAALADAKKKAVEYTATYLKSEANIKNFVLEKDLVSAYANATVKIIQELEKSWYKDAALGDCYRIRIKAEVVPDVMAMKKLSENPDVMDDPSAPLKVKAWTEKKEYRKGEKVKIYIKGNKPFYARVLYKDASGEILQLLPNPYRSENYFNGGTIYEIPTGSDKFDLEVSPPFGEENVIIFASVSPLGDIGVESQGAMYQVKTRAEDIGLQTRGIKLMEKTENKTPPAKTAEFFEDTVTIKTGK